MERKFSGFQFLFGNSPMHIKSDRPFIAFGNRVRSEHKEWLMRKTAGFRSENSLDCSGKGG